MSPGTACNGKTARKLSSVNSASLSFSGPHSHWLFGEQVKTMSLKWLSRCVLFLNNYLEATDSCGGCRRRPCVRESGQMEQPACPMGATVPEAPVRTESASSGLCTFGPGAVSACKRRGQWPSPEPTCHQPGPEHPSAWGGS